MSDQSQPTERMTPAFRYKRDPKFAALVQIIESYLHAAEFTPTEVREAAMLAATHYEMRRAPGPIRMIAGYAVVEPAVDPRAPPEVMSIDGVPYRLDWSVGKAPTERDNEKISINGSNDHLRTLWLAARRMGL